MPNIYAQAHIVCLPTYYGEGVPMVLLEAGASGKPIVTTDIPGCRDVVKHNENGLLVKPRNPVDLAAAIEELIADPERRKIMGMRGRIIVEKEFAEARIIDQTFQLYQEMKTMDASETKI